MIPLRVKPLGVSLLIGLVVGICLMLVLRGCGKNSTENAGPIIPPKQIVKEAEKSETEYKEKIAKLEAESQELNKQLVDLRVELSALKSKTKSREATIKKMIEPKGYPAKDLAGTGRSGSLPIDSSLSPCDSLAREVTTYIAENIQKDSLYEAQAVKQDSIITIKDSVIAATVKVHEDFKVLLAKSVDQQQVLYGENKSLKKQLKRQKFRSTLKTLGFIVLSGAAAYLLK